MPTILRVYAECLARVPKDIARSPWTLLIPPIYTVLNTAAGAAIGAIFRGPMALIGGFVMGFVQAVLFAAFLYFVDELTSGSPVRLGEIPNSFRRFVWPVLNVLFVV